MVSDILDHPVYSIKTDFDKSSNSFLKYSLHEKIQIHMYGCRIKALCHCMTTMDSLYYRNDSHIHFVQKLVFK